MDQSTLDEAMAELSSAEDFLEFFGIGYDPDVVRVNRLHILQRFHDYLVDADQVPGDERQRRQLYALWLGRAYQDFVTSDPLTEKVFLVFRRSHPRTIGVPVPFSGLAEARGEAERCAGTAASPGERARDHAATL